MLRVLFTLSLLVAIAQDTKSTAYKDEVSGISYELPAGYVIFRQNAESSKMNAAGLRILLVADKSTGRGFRNRIVLALDEASAYKEPPLTIEGYCRKMLTINSKRSGVIITREIQTLSLNKQTIYRGEYRETYPEVTLTKILVCEEIKGYWLSWTFVGTEHAELDDAILSVASARIIASPKTPKEDR